MPSAMHMVSIKLIFCLLQ